MLHRALDVPVQNSNNNKQQQQQYQQQHQLQQGLQATSYTIMEKSRNTNTKAKSGAHSRIKNNLRHRMGLKAKLEKE
jgi:hypothetical protein